MTARDQHLICDEIKRRLNSGSACCHSVKNLSSSLLQSKNLNLKLTELSFCQQFCMGVKLGLLTVGMNIEECRG
jgi:hypothetical protein